MSNEDKAAAADEVVVKAVKTFEGEEGFKTPESDAFPVSRLRFADLKANGLVVAVGDDAETPGADDLKKAAKPDNKQAPAPRNK